MKEETTDSYYEAQRKAKGSNACGPVKSYIMRRGKYDAVFCFSALDNGETFCFAEDGSVTIRTWYDVPERDESELGEMFQTYLPEDEA